MTKKIEIEAKISAPAAKVWEYYTDPKHIVHWNFASVDWCCPSAENDLRVGGTYKARMEAKDGSFGFDFEAIYSDMIPTKSFSYQLGDGRDVKVDFNAMEQGTEVKVAFDPESQNPVEMQRDGWQAILNNFKSYVERH
ncbi:MAG: activator of HSP90 ATPase [Saprospiraceae bacterium]|nr:activator of HSP90 ATPase [Saprospiraceae bacterium]